MKTVFFYHSLISDWNHGNAHFLRGVLSELLARGETVRVFEPAGSWSVRNLIQDQGGRALDAFRKAYPGLNSTRYAGKGEALDLDEALDKADLVIVHEWNEPELVRRIGEHHERSRGMSRGYKLLFHDTGHRTVSDPVAMRAYDLSRYDGVLAFGEVISRIYLENGMAERAWVWHEAADTRVFKPIAGSAKEGDLIWIGNWGDDERAAELREFLLAPISELGLKARVRGVRYPAAALQSLRAAGAEYRGWIANFHVPRELSAFRMTIHVPRRPYARALPGIPTIRMFEALACGIPLISAPWEDSEGLFRRGTDYLAARDGEQMKRLMRKLLCDAEWRSELAGRGLETIRTRHTCAHRVDQLLAILRSLRA